MKRVEEAEAPGIRATREHIQEMRNGRAVVTIARAGIASLALERGVAAERPILEGLVGTILTGLGAWTALVGLGGIAHGPVNGGVARFAAGAAFLVAIGVVLLARVLRVCDVVAITLENGDRRKLALTGRRTADERREFAARLRDLGWSVTAVSND